MSNILGDQTFYGGLDLVNELSMNLDNYLGVMSRHYFFSQSVVCTQEYIWSIQHDQSAKHYLKNAVQQVG